MLFCQNKRKNVKHNKKKKAKTKFWYRKNKVRFKPEKN